MWKLLNYLSNWQEKILLLERCRAIIKSCRADFSSNQISSRWSWPVWTASFLLWDFGFEMSLKQCFPDCQFLVVDSKVFLRYPICTKNTNLLCLPFFMVFAWKCVWNELQWKPLNVITLEQCQTDNINRMITITECAFYEKK